MKPTAVEIRRESTGVVPVWTYLARVPGAVPKYGYLDWLGHVATLGAAIATFAEHRHARAFCAAHGIRVVG